MQNLQSGQLRSQSIPMTLRLWYKLVRFLYIFICGAAICLCSYEKKHEPFSFINIFIVNSSNHMYFVVRWHFSYYFYIKKIFSNKNLCCILIDMTAEKNLRGVLRSEVDRSVSRGNIVIVDSLNSIKVKKLLFVCNSWSLNNINCAFCILHCYESKLCLILF